MKCKVTMCVFCGASIPGYSNNKKYEEHLQHWHNITIYQEVETAMARSCVRETGIVGEKDEVTESCQTIIQEDTAADGEDFVTVQEELIEQEDCFKKWKKVESKKIGDLEGLVKKLEEEREKIEKEVEKWKIKDDLNTFEIEKTKKDLAQLWKTIEELKMQEDEKMIERKKDKDNVVQLWKTVKELKEEIRKERVMKEQEKKKLSEEREREFKRKWEETKMELQRNIGMSLARKY